ncbi:hypothetical protein ACFL1H_00930 [Nanoarchaeota archaeon]
MAPTTSEDLEKVINPKGRKKLWTPGDLIADRQDKTRNNIALLIVISYLLVTLTLIILKVTSTGSIDYDSSLYYTFSSLVAVIIGFYFGQSQKT